MPKDIIVSKFRRLLIWYLALIAICYLVTYVLRGFQGLFGAVIVSIAITFFIIYAVMHEMQKK